MLRTNLEVSPCDKATIMSIIVNGLQLETRRTQWNADQHAILIGPALDLLLLVRMASIIPTA